MDTPRAPQSEQSIIALCAQDPVAAVEARALGLRDRDFYDPQHRASWLAMTNGGDGSTLLERLESRVGQGRAFRDGQALVAYHQSLMRAAPHRYHLDRYVAQVHDARARRGALAGAQQTMAMLEQSEPTDEILAHLQKNARQTAAAVGGGIEIATGQQLYAQADRDKAAGTTQGELLHTGWAEWEKLIELHRGDYCSVLGLAKHGKTTFGLSLAHQLAVTNDVDVVFFSGEMTAPMMRNRLMKRRPRLDHPRLHFVFERRLDRILSAIRIMAMQLDDLAAVFVDYWQWLKLPRHPDGRTSQLHQASQDFCGAVKDVGALGVMLTQADAVAVRKRPKGQRRPILSDTRECKAIEHDVDVGLVLHTDSLWEDIQVEDQAKQRSEVIARAQREGTPDATAVMRWDRKEGWWRTRTEIERVYDTAYPPGGKKK